VPEEFRSAIVMPAYNEADRIAATLAACHAMPLVVGVVVANDGSRDDTETIALRSGALVCSCRRNQGKGAALEMACAFLERVRPFGRLDAVLFLDADLEASASQAASLLVPLVRETADMTIAILPAPVGKAGFGLVKRLAVEGIAEFGGGFSAQAPLSGQRALTWDCLVRVRPFAFNFAVEVDMTIKALRQKQRVAELPVQLGHREYGRNLRGFCHRGKQFMDIYELLNRYRRKQRRKVDAP
jgi:glycosyltransferase involved in cell wall biosynthesis